MTTLGCVLLAAGNARRFGSNKLFARFGGETLIEHALSLASLGCFDARCVVTQYEEIARLAEARGIPCVMNGRPEDGISLSVKLGAEALADCGGWLFLASDQPGLRSGTLAALAALWREEPETPAALAYRGRRRAPCILPKRLYPGIRALTGDVGGAQLLKHEPRIRLLEAAPEELADVDTPEELAGVRAEG